MLALVSFASAALYHAHEEKAFVSWMRNNNQLYSGDEYQLRFGIYLTNSRLVQEHNAKGTFKVALNKFAALTPSEYKALLGFKPQIRQNKAIKSNFKRADSLDWRLKGAVNEIKDQGQCGSSWAFSAIASAESANFLSSGKLERYSEANLVDCVDDLVCYGCHGGQMSPAFDYVIAKQGGRFNLESDYPYKPSQDRCRFSASKAVGSIRSYIEVNEGDEDELADKCAEYGPVCVGFDASLWSFQCYSSGIYDEPACSPVSLSGAGNVVGYGAEGGTDYWILRISWGVEWGEAGYMRMIRNKGNQCGIATMASVPIA